MINIKKLTQLKELDIVNLSRLCERAELSVKTIHSKISRQTALTETEASAITRVLREMILEIKKST